MEVFFLNEGYERSILWSWGNLSALWLPWVMSASTKVNELHMWVKVFKNGPSKICGRQPSKNMK